MRIIRYLPVLICLFVQPAGASSSVQHSRFGELNGRSRVVFGFGFRSQSDTTSQATLSGSEHLTLGFSYSHWLRENLALSVTMSILSPEVGTQIGPVAFTTNGVVAALVGARFYLPDLGSSSTVKPYVTGSVGPYIGSGKEIGAHTTKTVTVVSPGAHVGAGLDFQLHRSFMLGLRGGYHFMSDFSQPLAGQDSFSGFELGVEVSWLFGK
jgi:hypothetical protein